ncbi:MAG: DUF4382 domain-containing protein [Chloroflexi bacterium]|nr:DUF4382 domain-containing protein [Chloroflexota bacterium]
MKRRILFPLLGLSVPVLLLAACGDESTPSTSTPGPSGATGKAVLAISDAAPDMGAIQSIKITFDAAKVHASGGAWTTVSTTTQTFDLLELKAKGTAQLLAEADLQPGTYDQVELSVSKVIVVDDKGQHEAKLPSNKLQIKGDLEVKTGSTAVANFDFLADQSLHVTGEGTYILAPVVKVETRSEAKVEVQANKEVRISSGRVKTDHQVGMDAEGSVDVGLRIPADAVLSIAASGKIVQPKGQAMAVGVVKAVDTANGTVTITTKGGNEIVLHIASDSQLKVRNEKASLASLAGNIGAEVTTEFNVETKRANQIVARADDKAKAEVGAELSLSGTIKAVNTSAGTVHIESDSGPDVILKVDSDSKLQLDGSGTSLLTLAGRIGARVQATYDATGHAVEGLQAQAEATVTASGTLKAVDIAKGSITITTQAGADVTLDVASHSKVLINGSLATLASLKAAVGSTVTVTYSQQSKVVNEMSVQATMEQKANASGVIKAVNPAQGTVTIQTGSGQEIVLNVTAASNVVADGAISSLAQLAANIGAKATALYDAQTRFATSINAEAHSQGTARASGILKRVDLLSSNVTIATGSDSDLTLSITPSSKVFFNTALSSLASLAVNLLAPVTVEYNAQTNTALVLSAQIPPGVTPAPQPTPTPRPGATPTPPASGVVSVSGTLKAVDLLGSSVTIATQSSGDLTLKIGPSSRLFLNSTFSILAALALQINAPVTVEYNAQTETVLVLSVQGQSSTPSPTPSASPTATPAPQPTPTPPPAPTATPSPQPAPTATPTPASGVVSVSGTLKAVNLLASTVTIGVQGGADLVLNVGAQSQITIGGSVTSFAALTTKIGSQAAVEYNVQTMVVLSLNVAA